MRKHHMTPKEVPMKYLREQDALDARNVNKALQAGFSNHDIAKGDITWRRWAGRWLRCAIVSAPGKNAITFTATAGSKRIVTKYKGPRGTATVKPTRVRQKPVRKRKSPWASSLGVGVESRAPTPDHDDQLGAMIAWVDEFKADFTPEEQASVVRDFVDHLDVRSAYLVVHDWGGPIGLRAAQQRSDRFAGLIITATLAWPDYRRRASWWVRLMMGFLASERGRSFTLKNNLILEGPLRSEMNKGTRPPSEQAKKAYRGPFPTAESRYPTWVLAHHLWTSIGDSFLTTVEQDLPILGDLQTLLVFGEADRFTTPKQSMPRFEQSFPNHESVLIEGAGHFFPESEPDALTNAIRAWLNKTASEQH